MTDDSREEDPGAGGEGQGQEVMGVETANGGTVVGDEGGGDMEAESHSK